MLSPTPFSSGGASTDTASIRATTSSKLSSGSGAATQPPPIHPTPAFPSVGSPSTPRSQSPGTQVHPPPPSPEQTSLRPNATPVNKNPEISSGRPRLRTLESCLTLFFVDHLAIPISNVASQSTPFAINTTTAQSFPLGAVPVLLSANIDFNELMSHLNERDQPNESLPSYPSHQEGGGVHPFDIR
jgi:hypothetical protein